MNGGPASYLEVTPKEIDQLDKDSLTALCNDLLDAERHSASEPPGSVLKTMNTSVGDGGVDAVTDFSVNTAFVPQGLIAWAI